MQQPWMLSPTLPWLCLFVEISLQKLIPSSRISTRIMRTLILLSKTLVTLEMMLKVSESGSLPANTCIITWLSRQFTEKCNLRGLERKSRQRKQRVNWKLKQLLKRLKELIRRQNRQGKKEMQVGGMQSQFLVILNNIKTKKQQMIFKQTQINMSQTGLRNKVQHKGQIVS